MPIYEFVCSDCTSEFELLVRADESLACPSCESEKLEKQFSVTAAPQSSSQSTQGSLPIAGPESCSAPRCCGGGCQS